MSKPGEDARDENDVRSDVRNPNNNGDMDTWADAHNPNNDSYFEDAD